MWWNMRKYDYLCCYVDVVYVWVGWIIFRGLGVYGFGEGLG